MPRGLEQALEGQRHAETLTHEQWRVQAELNHRSWEKHIEWHLENFRGLLTLSALCIKLTLTISSGSLVVLLAFVGQVWTKSPEQAIAVANALRYSWHYFSGSVVLCLLIGGLAYLAQCFFGYAGDVNYIDGKPEKSRPKIEAIAVGLQSSAMFSWLIILYFIWSGFEHSISVFADPTILIK